MNSLHFVGRLLILHNNTDRTHRITMPNNKGVREPLVVTPIISTGTFELARHMVYSNIQHFAHQYSQVQIYDLQLASSEDVIMRRVGYLMRGAKALIPTCKPIFVRIPKVLHEGIAYHMIGARGAAVLKEYTHSLPLPKFVSDKSLLTYRKVQNEMGRDRR